MLVRQWECKTNSWIIMLNLRRAQYYCLWDLLGRISWWSELVILRGSGKAGYCLRTDSEHKNGLWQCAEGGSSMAERQQGWTGHCWPCFSARRKQRRKQRQAAWKECGDTVWVCRDGAAKVQSNLELKLARHTEIYKKGFFYICWQPRKIWVHQLNGAGDLEKKRHAQEWQTELKKTKLQ